jgi:alpha-beta hydrolase superfamily lysophospholipase
METAEKASCQDLGSLLFDFSGNGASDGSFGEMTPNRRIAELSTMLKYASAGYAGPLFLLGMSMGGAISVYAAAARKPPLAGLITWSCVPSFDLAAASSHWHPQAPEPDLVTGVGQAFFDDRPTTDVGKIYETLEIPKLQVQGDADKAFFAREFKAFYDKAPDPKRLIMIHGADHVFSTRAHRDQAIQMTLDWIDLRLP